MRREFRWAPSLAQTVAWSAIALIGVTTAMAQIDQADNQNEARNQREPSANQTDDPNRRAADERVPDEDAAARNRTGEEPETRRGEAREPGRRDETREPGRRDAAGQPSNERAPGRDLGDRQDRNAGEREGETRGPRGLGVSIEAEEEGSLTVTDVEQDSVAARAGLRVDDRILSADGRRFRNPRQLRAYLGSQFGRRVPIVIERGGRQYTVQLMPGNGDEGAWLGVYMEDDEDNQIGARVTHVYPTSPAARAGFRPGDVIVEVNGQPVEGSPDVIAMVEEQEPGSPAKFRVRRGDREVDLTATLGRRDAFVSFGRDRSSGRREGEFEEDDPYGRVPPHLMQLEHDRRMAEQHQRIEEALRDLQEEVKQLRAEIMKGR